MIPKFSLAIILFFAILIASAPHSIRPEHASVADQASGGVIFL